MTTGRRFQMNKAFQDATLSIPALFDALKTSKPLLQRYASGLKGKAGVYVFTIEGDVAHVGRTRNLLGRLSGHLAGNHNSASFAFKLARRKLNIKATYKTKGSRAELMKDKIFKTEFDAARKSIKACEVRFLEVTNPVEQYLLELYAHMEFGLQLDEFDTH